MQFEDAALALFSTGGGLTVLAQVLSNNTDPRVSAFGALLLAIGGVAKALAPKGTPPPAPVNVPPVVAAPANMILDIVKPAISGEISKLPPADQNIANLALGTLETYLQKSAAQAAAGAAT